VTERVIMAGFGGQGMMMIGKVYATAIMEAGFNVTFLPSYGAEVRGGTAHCHVIASQEPIYSPMIDTADTLIIMNQPSYTKFRPRLRRGGLLLLNSSLAQVVAEQEEGADVTCLSLPATELADNLGAVRVANTIMLGAYTTMRPIVATEAVFATLAKGMTGAKAKLLPLNRKAFDKGIELAK